MEIVMCKVIFVFALISGDVTEWRCHPGVWGDFHSTSVSLRAEC